MSTWAIVGATIVVIIQIIFLKIIAIMVDYSFTREVKNVVKKIIRIFKFLFTEGS